MKPEDAESRIHEFVAHFNDGDVDAIPRFIGTEFYQHRPGTGEPGAADVIHGLAIELRHAMSNLAVEVHEVVEADYGLRCRITLSGTHDGPLWGAPPTQRRLTWPVWLTLRRVADRFAVSFDDVTPPVAVGLLRELDIVNPADEMDQPMKHPVVIPEVIVRLAFTGQMADKPCAHIDQVRVIEPQAHECAACVASGDIWPALRMCLMCGFVGCCDTSKNRHMKGHHESTGHPIFRSIRMDEGWIWCYEDNAFFGRSRLAVAR